MALLEVVSGRRPCWRQCLWPCWRWCLWPCLHEVVSVALLEVVSVTLLEVVSVALLEVVSVALLEVVSVALLEVVSVACLHEVVSVALLVLLCLPFSSISVSKISCGMHPCEMQTHVRETVDPLAATLLSILLRSTFCLKKKDLDLVVASWRGLSCCLMTFSSGCSMPCISSRLRNRFRDIATPLSKGNPRRGANLTRGLTTVKT